MDSILKIIYSHNYLDTDNRLQYHLNGVHTKVIDYITKRYETNKDVNSIIREIQDKNPGSKWDAFFRHSNFLSYYKKYYGKANIIEIADIKDDDSIYLWPIEIGTYWGDVTATATLHIEDEYIEYSFIDTIDPVLLSHMRSGRVKILFNIIHDPLNSEHQIYSVEKYFSEHGIDPSNIIIIGGNDFQEYYKKIPEGKSKILYGYIMVQQAGDRLDSFPYTSSLGYVSDMVRESDLDINTIRPKRFLCWNRTMRPHRLLLAYIAVKYNLIENSYFSFLTNPGNGEVGVKNAIGTYAGDIEKSLYGTKVYNLFPLDLDTHHLLPEQKTGFSSNNNKKELYANSYVHITSETAFYEDISSPFFSEKTFHSMVNLQPFIYVGCAGALKLLKEWGIKTFHPFIDESYDDERDPTKRLKMIENQIKKLNDMPIKDLHDWYYSITDILLHNQNTIRSFSSTNPFEHALNQIKQIYGNT